MHELSVCRGLLDQVTRVAARHGAIGVARITVSVGPLSGVEPQLLAHAFPIARTGSIAEAADLVIETPPLRVACDGCGAETTATPSRLVCGHCGDCHTRLTSGDELILTGVELIT